MCVALPSGLPRGPIVLEGFVGNMFRYELGSTQEEVKALALLLASNNNNNAIILYYGAQLQFIPH